MAIRLKARWHRSNRSERNRERSRQPKSLQDLASAISINIWKLAKEVFMHMEKQGFRFREDRQAIAVINEVMAFSLHILDRMIFGRISEDERALFINDVASRLMEAMKSNQEDLLGPGDYQEALVSMLNDRLAHYAQCRFVDGEGPAYDFKVFLALKIAEAMAESDDKWVVEQVVEIEAPMVVEKLMPMVENLLGLRQRPVLP